MNILVGSIVTGAHLLSGRLAVANRKIAVCFGFAFLALLISGTTATSVAADTKTAPAETGAAQITILYDAFGKPSAMRKDWGFSA